LFATKECNPQPIEEQRAMTKKDYVLIAEALKDLTPVKMADTGYYQGSSDTHYTMCHKLADALANDNPAFDWARFLEACGV